MVSWHEISKKEGADSTEEFGDRRNSFAYRRHIISQCQCPQLRLAREGSSESKSDRANSSHSYTEPNKTHGMAYRGLSDTWNQVSTQPECSDWIGECASWSPSR